MHSKLYKKIFEDKWPSEIGGVLLAFLNILMILHSRPIGGFNAVLDAWGRWIYKITWLNIQTPIKLVQPPIFGERYILVIGFVLGVFFSALLAKQFRIRRDNIGGYTLGFIGGALMGIGSSIAGGCNLGGFYSSVMALSLNGFIMMLGLIIGAYIGGRFMVWQINRQAERLFELDVCHKEKPSEDTKKDYKHRQPKIAAAVALLIISISSLFIFGGKSSLGIMILFGAAFGIVFQRSAFCITAAFREIFITKSTRMMRSLLISLIIGVIGFSIIKASGYRPMDMFVFQAGLSNLIGGIIFGFGMTITGG